MQGCDYMGGPRSDFIDVIQELVKIKPLDKISIDEIAEAAGYARQTFYRHFSDKYELAFAVYETDMQAYIASLPENWDFRTLCKGTLSCFANKVSFYKRVFKNSQMPNSFHMHFVEYSTKYTLDAIGRRRLSKDQQQIIRYWVTNTVSVTERWLLGGMKESVDWVVEMYVRLMPEEIKQLYFE